MATINDIKEQSITATPLLLFECVLSSGAVERWSTHAATVNGEHYSARVLRHDLFEMQSGAVDGIDAIAKVSLWLANADSHLFDFPWICIRDSQCATPGAYVEASLDLDSRCYG